MKTSLIGNKARQKSFYFLPNDNNTKSFANFPRVLFGKNRNVISQKNRSKTKPNLLRNKEITSAHLAIKSITESMATPFNLFLYSGE
jgi:hypothetical protein